MKRERERGGDEGQREREREGGREREKEVRRDRESARMGER